MLLLPILVSEVVGLPRVPVVIGQGLPRGHPEELALFRLVGAAGPEVLMSHACQHRLNTQVSACAQTNFYLGTYLQAGHTRRKWGHRANCAHIFDCC